MTFGCRSALLVTAVALALLPAAPLSARQLSPSEQPPVPPPADRRPQREVTQTRPPSGQPPQSAAPVETPQPAPKAVPAQAPPRRGGEARVELQGFSIVLVLADLQPATGQDDVPPAARNALADMKDFLPYKSYRLLDAAWVLGQGNSATVTRLRGPDDREYEVRVHTSPARFIAQGLTATGTHDIYVQFTLRDGGAAEEHADQTTIYEHLRTAEAALASDERRQEIARLEAELAAARQKKDEARVQALEKQLRTARSRATQAQRPKYAVTPRADRAVIDTSFTMEVGETVVVGTSRLKGNSKALIALLTAVPPKGGRR
jgi:hypothetical protein